MIRYLLALVLLALASCQECYAGYSIAVWEQIQPTYVIALRYGAEQLILNRGTPPTRQLTWSKQICEARDPWSADISLRSEVWEDSAGTAASADLFAACPQIRETKEREIRSGGSKRLLDLASPYSAEERESWAQQADEATLYQADSNCPCAMIRNMASTRGIPLGLMAEKILENATLFKAASGQILGYQQKLIDRIYSETDFATLLGIGW